MNTTYSHSYISQQLRARPIALAACGPQVPLQTYDTWPTFWSRVHSVLRLHGYRRSSMLTARQVLRGLAAHCRVPPSQLTRRQIDAYLHALAHRHCSASWIAMNISILRTVFDKLSGLDLLGGRRGPKRPSRLPAILPRQDVQHLLEATLDFREHLLLGLLYGCGLRISEACALRWQDVDPAQATLSIPASGSAVARQVPIPQRLLPLLAEGHTRFGPHDWVFTGRRAGTPLSVRMAERLVRRCAQRAGLQPTVTGMLLRNTFAVHALEHGMNIRQLQTLLGHAGVETTLRYQRCILPAQAVSPLDQMHPATDALNPDQAYRPEPHLNSHLPQPASRTLRLRDWLERLRGSTAT